MIIIAPIMIIFMMTIIIIIIIITFIINSIIILMIITFMISILIRSRLVFNYQACVDIKGSQSQREEAQV